MNILDLLKQDVINITESFKYGFEEEPVNLFTSIFLSVVIIFLSHLQIKRITKPDYIIQKIGMRMDYVYKGSNCSYFFINKRYDGKIDIANEQGETMFSKIEDALSLSEIINNLKERH